MREDEIRARLANATPGPWHVQNTTAGYDVIQGGERQSDSVYIASMGVESVGYAEWRQYAGSDADAEFIAHAPDDLAYLLEENARLRKPLPESTLDLEAIEKWSKIVPYYTQWWEVSDHFKDLIAEVKRLRRG